jgi:hypothetical protein
MVEGTRERSHQDEDGNIAACDDDQRFGDNQDLGLPKDGKVYDLVLHKDVADSRDQ